MKGRMKEREGRSQRLASGKFVVKKEIGKQGDSVCA
jgi:hypothetical protein